MSNDLQGTHLQGTPSQHLVTLFALSLVSMAQPDAKTRLPPLFRAIIQHDCEQVRLLLADPTVNAGAARRCRCST